MSVRIGTNPIAWSNDDLPELGGETPRETCLAEASAAGFTGIEMGNKFPRERASLAEQDPAKAPPLAYARKGFSHLRAAAEQAGFRIA